ncbi:hypothetical protein GCM10023080_066500 [Streptomyces pseudoechinosporeus]
MPRTEKIGNVSVQRYEQIVEKLRDAVEKLSNQHPDTPALRDDPRLRCEPWI